MNLKSMLLLVTAFILYLVIGALIFSALESTQEEETKVDLRQYKESILSNLTCLSEDGLEELIGKIRYAVDNGINPTYNVSSHSNWDFSNSFFFSGTVVTTIGYGKRSPTTQGGRDFCILYALVGIPFLGWLLSIVGEFYRESFWSLTHRIDWILCDYCSVTQRKLRRFLVWFVVASIIYSALVLAPAGIFTTLENWDYRTAHYYCFITLTTIGFGDYVATVNPKHDSLEVVEIIYDLAVVFWYIFGLSFLAVVISAIGTRERKTAEKIASSFKPQREVKPENGAVVTLSGDKDALDKEAVEVTVGDGIVGSVHYRTGGGSENRGADLSREVHVHVVPASDQNNVPLSASEESPGSASPEYSLNDNNGKAFNEIQGSDYNDIHVPLETHVQMQNGDPDKRKMSLRKKVSFDSSCINSNDGTGKIRQKATGKRKVSSRSSQFEVTRENDENEAGGDRMSPVTMTTSKICCNCNCHANDIGAN